MRTPDKWMHARKPFAYIPRAGLAGRLAALWIQLWGISSKRNIEQLLSKCLFPSRISSEHQQVHLIFLNILRGMLKSISSQWQKAAFRIFWKVPKKAPGKTSFDFLVLWLIWVCSIQNPFPFNFQNCAPFHICEWEGGSIQRKVRIGQVTCTVSAMA